MISTIFKKFQIPQDIAEFHPYFRVLLQQVDEDLPLEMEFGDVETLRKDIINKNFNDLLIDFRSKLVFFNLCGYHHLMGQFLYMLNEFVSGRVMTINDRNKILDSLDYDTTLDEYLQKGYGAFVSRVSESGNILVGEMLHPKDILLLKSLNLRIEYL